MTERTRLHLIILLALTSTFFTAHAFAQRAPVIYHRIEGRLLFRGAVNNVRVRVLQRSGLIPVDEAYTRGEGEFAFSRVPEGEYVIQTDETDTFATSETVIRVFPLDRSRSQVFRINIQLEPKRAAATEKAAVLMADVDLNVPKEAQKNYREGMKALESGSHERAIAKLQAALKSYPDYYAARLELGRELRTQKRFAEAAEVLKPAIQLASKRADPRVEYGFVLMALERRDEAIALFGEALKLEETNWLAHLYLGMSLLEADAGTAEQHLRRARY